MQTMHFSSYAVKEKYHTHRKMLKTICQIREIEQSDVTLTRIAERKKIDNAQQQLSSNHRNVYLTSLCIIFCIKQCPYETEIDLLGSSFTPYISKFRLLRQITLLCLKGFVVHTRSTEYTPASVKDRLTEARPQMYYICVNGSIWK